MPPIKSTVNFSSLCAHIKKQHFSQMTQDFQCGVCKDYFLNEQSLKQHFTWRHQVKHSTSVTIVPQDSSRNILILWSLVVHCKTHSIVIIITFVEKFSIMFGINSAWNPVISECSCRARTRMVLTIYFVHLHLRTQWVE